MSGGKFKVSFFGPFYGPYWVIELLGDESDGYSVSVVYACTEEIIKIEYMWILSRTPDLPSGVTFDQLYKTAEGYGIDVSSLNVTQSPQDGCWN